MTRRGEWVEDRDVTIHANSKGLASLSPLRIGPHVVEPPIILAPMAGVSEVPFRAMALEFGAGLAPTELISAKGLEYGNRRTEDYLRHDPAKEPIFTVQLFGGEPESMGFAAERAVHRGACIVDINMGCPVKKVTKTGAGSAILCDPRRAAEIVRAMRRRVGDAVPITAKIRSGWDASQRNGPEVARAMEDEGLAAIAMHPRTRTQGYSGRADWGEIRRLKESVSIPVIANGDITCADDANRVVHETGCDAVMIGRKALGNPWIFTELAAAYHRRAIPRGPTPEERARQVSRHLVESIEHTDDEARAIRKFRQHLIWYSRGLRNGAAFRSRVLHVSERARLEDAIAEYFSSAEMSDASEAPIYEERFALG